MPTAIVVLEIVLAVLALLLYGSIFLFIFSHAPYVPTRRRELERLMKLANIKAGERVYDLGSGDGKVVLSAAERGARATGIERQPLLVFLSRWRARRRGLGDLATFVTGNFFKKDLSDAQVVCCYLLPQAMQRLKAKFERELRPGTRVVSVAFAIHDWQPVAVDRDGKTAPIFVYLTPQH